MELGEALRDRRKAAGRTIASVAVDAGLSVPYIANLENGRGNPTVSALERLAAALDARLEVNLTDEPPEPPEPPQSAVGDLLAGSQRADQVIKILAAHRSKSRSTIRADLIRTLDALALLLGRAPEPADLDRLLDLQVLAVRRP